MVSKYFDGCVTATQGLQACQCAYCTELKMGNISDDFPENYPSNFKDRNILDSLHAKDDISAHNDRLNNQFQRIANLEGLDIPGIKTQIQNILAKLPK